MRRQPDGTWSARTVGRPEISAAGASRAGCLASLKRSVSRMVSAGSPKERLTLVVEAVPELAGVAEAAEVMGWDKRRVITYIDRGRFPTPVQSLASGRVWVRADVEEYARAWRARRRGGRR